MAYLDKTSTTENTCCNTQVFFQSILRPLPAVFYSESGLIICFHISIWIRTEAFIGSDIREGPAWWVSCVCFLSGWLPAETRHSVHFEIKLANQEIIIYTVCYTEADNHLQFISSCLSEYMMSPIRQTSWCSCWHWFSLQQKRKTDYYRLGRCKLYLVLYFILKTQYLKPFWDLISGIGPPKMICQWFKVEKTAAMCISMSSLLPLSGAADRASCFRMSLEPLLWLAEYTLSDTRPGLSPFSFWQIHSLWSVTTGCFWTVSYTVIMFVQVLAGQSANVGVTSRVTIQSFTMEFQYRVS